LEILHWITDIKLAAQKFSFIFTPMIIKKLKKKGRKIGNPKR